MAPPEARAQVKIYEFDVTIKVNDDVVRLDIPVDDAHWMNWLNSKDKLWYVKPARG